MSLHSEASPLLGLQFVGRNDHRFKKETGPSNNAVVTTNDNRKNLIWSIFLSFGTCIDCVYHLVPIILYNVPKWLGSRLTVWLFALFLSACIVTAYHLRKTNSWYRNGSMVESAESFLSSTSHLYKSNDNSPYTKVQTLSFQIYTGGAPAFVMDETTGEEKRNHECKGCK